MRYAACDIAVQRVVQAERAQGRAHGLARFAREVRDDLVFPGSARVLDRHESAYRLRAFGERGEGALAEIPRRRADDGAREQRTLAEAVYEGLAAVDERFGKQDAGKFVILYRGELFEAPVHDAAGSVGFNRHALLRSASSAWR